MSETDRLNYLAGQVSALRGFVEAVIKSHPDKPKLIEEYNQFKEKQLAMTIPTTMPEYFIKGQQEIYDNFQVLFVDKS